MKLNVLWITQQGWTVKSKHLTTTYSAAKLRRMSQRTLLSIYIAKSPGLGEFYTSRGWLMEAILQVQARTAVNRAQKLGKRFIDRALA